MMKPDLKSMGLLALEEYFEGLGEKKYRAGQVFRWIHKGVYSFDEMSDLPAELREKLEREAAICALALKNRRTSRRDGTRKYLFELADGNTIESVLMRYKFGNSICVSSQAGCRMGCIFCASGKNGLARDLTPGEMADQVLRVQNDVGVRLRGVTVMGVGEPFDNYANLSELIKIINHKQGLNIGMRNITVSTCGIIPGIKAFSKDFPNANLAVSLHAPGGRMRAELMPAAGQYKYDELISACRDYTDTTGRRITFEYILIDGKNDHVSQAAELAGNLRGMLCHVNLIPVNGITETPRLSYSGNNGEIFKKKLEEKGIPVTLRRELGGDIGAACGQLRLVKSGS